MRPYRNWQTMASVLLSTLIAEAISQQRFRADADVARALGVEPVRLYQWKTHRRRMPSSHVINLSILAGRDVVQSLGQYEAEWELVKAHPELVGSQ